MQISFAEWLVEVESKSHEAIIESLYEAANAEGSSVDVEDVDYYEGIFENALGYIQSAWA